MPGKVQSSRGSESPILWQMVQVRQLRWTPRSVDASKSNPFLSFDFTQNLGFYIRQLLFVGTVYEVLIPDDIIRDFLKGRCENKTWFPRKNPEATSPVCFAYGHRQCSCVRDKAAQAIKQLWASDYNAEMCYLNHRGNCWKAPSYLRRHYKFLFIITEYKLRNQYLPEAGGISRHLWVLSLVRGVSWEICEIRAVKLSQEKDSVEARLQ